VKASVAALHCHVISSRKTLIVSHPEPSIGIHLPASRSSHNITLLQRLLGDPDNEELLRETASQLYANPVDFAEAAKAVIPLWPHEQQKTLAGKNTWENCIGNQICHPVQIVYPQSLQDLKDEVKQASAMKVPLRAVGSGHSFSDVAVTDGILLMPQSMNHVIAVDSSVLKDAPEASTLFSVQSGITIKKLNQELDTRGLALINMGAYDGQTLAGAICTGTHGTGAGLGNIASSVRSLVIVSETGIVYQIEPSAGITDPAKFVAKHQDIVLKQDDDWFQSIIVAMGCMGIIYSYTLQVMPAYYLLENRQLGSWEAIKPSLVPPSPGQLPSIITQHRYFEIDVNPYAINGIHKCIITTRDIHAGPPSGSRGASNWLSGLVATFPLLSKTLVGFLNLTPKLIPSIVNSALTSLADSNYVDKSYKVLNLGEVNEIKSYAIEFSFDGPNFVQSIDKLLNLIDQAGKEHGWYQTGPIGIRFVQAADGYLSPQYGRVTCTAECDMLDGIHSGQNLLRYIEKTVLGDPGVRIHWGLELDTVEGKEVSEMYPKYPQWLAVYQQLNTTGMFNNRFTDRIGISKKQSGWIRSLLRPGQTQR